jgi:hypothetical protein
MGDNNMKFCTILLALSFFTFTTETYAYESFDLSPSEEMEYSENDNYTDRSMVATNSDYEPSYKHHYDDYSHKRYIGRGKVFIFDPKVLQWYAYYNGNLINSGRASGGRHYCPDIHRPCRTPTGVFRVNSKGGPDCKSSKYPVGRGNAPMPWCMFFHRGYAIHGSWAVPGYNASHGCIRVLPAAAQWLNHHFMNAGTTVIVRGYGRR